MCVCVSDGTYLKENLPPKYCASVISKLLTF